MRERALVRQRQRSFTAQRLGSPTRLMLVEATCDVGGDTGIQRTTGGTQHV